jgi:hypothetical protein
VVAYKTAAATSTRGVHNCGRDVVVAHSRMEGGVESIESIGEFIQQAAVEQGLDMARIGPGLSCCRQW